MNVVDLNSSVPIRVGLIGAGAWATQGHIRVLKRLGAYQLSAIYARRPEVAEAVAAEHGFAHVARSVEELVAHPEVDLVVVANTAPQHADSVRAALAAGKHVYAEWPLTTSTATAGELLQLAEQAGVHHIVGLQRRLAPHNRYLKDLVDGGFVGELRAVRLHVSIPYLGQRRSQSIAWTLPSENFSDAVTIYAGHFLDMVFAALGWPKGVSAIQANQFPQVTIDETGETVPNGSDDQLVLIGHLTERALLSVHIEGGKHHGNGVQLDITGDAGDLQIRNRSAFGDIGADYAVRGAKASDNALVELPIPAHYAALNDADLPSSVLELAETYAAFARDVREGTTTAPSFVDGLRLHRLFDAVAEATAQGDQIDLQRATGASA